LRQAWATARRRLRTDQVAAIRQAPGRQRPRLPQGSPPGRPGRARPQCGHAAGGSDGLRPLSATLQRSARLAAHRV